MSARSARRGVFTGAALVSRYLAAREAEGIRKATRQLQNVHLCAFVLWLAERGAFDLRHVTPEDLRAYQRHLVTYRYSRSKAESEPKKKLAPRSRYDALATICRLFRWLVTSRLLLADPSATLELGRRQRFQPANVLTEAEVQRLLDAPDASSHLGLRDRALLELLYSSGLRRAEASALDVGDVDLGGGTVLVASGKGGRSRLVPLGERAAAVLRHYIESARPALLKRAGVTALFLSAAGNRFCRESIWSRVRLAARCAGIARNVAPHALRHTLATHLLRAGANLRHVQAILGHARIDTTEAYTHLDIEDLARAHARSHPRSRRAP